MPQTCGGSGQQRIIRQVGPGMVTQQVIPCQTCGGSGVAITKRCA
eukprot:gene8312-5528_t